MKAARALVYVESSTEVIIVTLEFRCWEQLYASIQFIQCTNPAQKAGLERVIDPIPQNFPIFEWQISPPYRLTAARARPQPLIVR
jgi:hypothetical protein